MNTIGAVPPPTFQTVATHSPLGKPAVGIEASDAPLPPVEESAATDELMHRDVIAKQHDQDGRQGREREGLQDEASQQQENADPELQARAKLEEQLALAAQTATIAPLPATYQARHLAEFEHNTLPPGSLLDQQI